MTSSGPVDEEAADRIQELAASILHYLGNYGAENAEYEHINTVIINSLVVSLIMLFRKSKNIDAVYPASEQLIADFRAGIKHFIEEKQEPAEKSQSSAIP